SPSFDPAALQEALKARRQPLLVMHSPIDETAPFQQGSDLFQQAPGPKSFICLDDTDHLLSRKEDANYVGGVIGSWVKRYLNFEERESLKVEKQVAVRLGETGYTTEVQMRHHSLTADEPEDKGGNDYGPAPYDLVSAALGACTAMTLHMYARRKKWPLKEVTVHLSHFKDYSEDMENVVDGKNSKIDHFECLIDVKGDLDQAQRERLLEIANKCPVHRTLHNPVKVLSS
ncbi:bifunctional alpha/beta hydrolase/OsmC family protein, partial [Arthrospira platensis SPKY1]|nr:bifunctional alpha/beta hydrolase/OsmC family protein [Arthrospira platensis SPKY1]